MQNHTNRLLRLCLCFTFFLLTSSVVQSTNLQQGIDQILTNFNENINIGVIVQSMRNKKILYTKNSDRVFVPASSLKLLTAAAALLTLGPDYRFDTTILGRYQSLKKGIYRGNITLRFSGDPELKQRDLNHLIAQLHEKGIHTITGNFALDVTAFDAKPYGHGWMWDELNFCYAAPVDTVNINHNCFSFNIKPAKKIGKRAEITDKKAPAFLRITNTVKTQKSNTEDCDMDLKSDERNHYRISGCIHKNWRKKHLAVAIRNPREYAKHLIKLLLTKHHIILKGKIIEKVTPTKAKVLVVYHSKHLRGIIADMLKDSNNLAADALLIKLGAVYYKKPGTWKRGLRAMEAVLKEHAAMDFENTSVVDGGGLSRYNLISPAQMAQLLNFTYHDFPIAPELLASLPIAGKDGTLRQRMHTLNEAAIRGKTGSMAGVTSLAGYVYTKDHEVLSFVLMVNGFVGPVDHYKALEDQICLFLSKQ